MVGSDQNSSLFCLVISVEGVKFDNIVTCFFSKNGPCLQGFKTLFLVSNASDKEAEEFVPGKPF
jgi:hypothetical protein